MNRTGPQKLKKGGEHEQDRWVKTLVSAKHFKKLKVLALDKGISLKQLLREMISELLNNKE